MPYVSPAASIPTVAELPLFVVEVPVGTTILEALRAAGHEAPSSCESGTCGTCRTKLIEGEADHRDLVLTDDERASNIMICVSRAKSPQLVIDR